MLASLLRCRRAVAALEFAVIAPAAVVMGFGIYDIAMAVIVRQEVISAARLIPLSASNLAVQPDKSTSLTVAQVQQSLSGIFAEMPGRRSGNQAGLTSVTLSSVTFIQVNPSCDPSTTTCQMVPQVVWSVAYADPPGRNPGNLNTFKNVTRPCIRLSQTAPGANTAGDLTSLPTANIVNPDSILVADVHYRYQPLITVFLTGPIDFWASGYWAVRTATPGSAASTQYTRYDIANQSGGAGKCAGYT